MGYSYCVVYRWNAHDRTKHSEIESNVLYLQRLQRGILHRPLVLGQANADDLFLVFYTYSIRDRYLYFPKIKTAVCRYVVGEVKSL